MTAARSRAYDALNHELAADLGPDHDRHMLDDVPEPPPFVHRAQVMPAGWRRFEPQCTCGWRGKVVADADTARGTARSHVRTHRHHNDAVRVFGVGAP